MKVYRNIIQMRRERDKYELSLIYPCYLSKMNGQIVWKIAGTRILITCKDSIDDLINYFRNSNLPIMKRVYYEDVHDGSLNFGFQETDITDTYSVGEFFEALIEERLI